MPHRYFTTEIADGTAFLRGKDAHHLARVMRAKLGETVILCDGNAVEYTAHITGFPEDAVEFSVEEGYPSTAEPNITVTLYAGYPKQDKLEEIMAAQKPSVPPRDPTLTISVSKIARFFPVGCTKQQMENQILKILEGYFRQITHEHEREER